MPEARSCFGCQSLLHHGSLQHAVVVSNQVGEARHVREAGGHARRNWRSIGVSDAEAERQFEALVCVGDAAAMFRAHPECQAPGSLHEAIRAVLRGEGYWDTPLAYPKGPPDVRPVPASGPAPWPGFDLNLVRPFDLADHTGAEAT